MLLKDALEQNPNSTVKDFVISVLREHLTEDRCDAAIKHMKEVIHLPGHIEAVGGQVLDYLLPGRIIDAIENALTKSGLN